MLPRAKYIMISSCSVDHGHPGDYWNILDFLLRSEDASVRYKAYKNILNGKEHDRINEIQKQVKSSARVRLLLSKRSSDGRIPRHPYRWYGAHWVLVALADLGYPRGDRSLIPLREQVYDWLLDPVRRIRVVNDRPRIHASMEGNAIYSLLTLGLFDEKGEKLVDRLLKTQWSDGGWNCDLRLEAENSSFMESLIPLRALALHARLRGNRKSSRAARKAAEVFLERRLYKRKRNGRIIRADFVKLHYPCYWHYDILFGLKVMAEAGFIKDPRCREALTLLESKRLPDGGFPAEKEYYTVAKRHGRGLADWGVMDPSRMNEFVTVDALYVLKQGIS